MPARTELVPVPLSSAPADAPPRGAVPNPRPKFPRDDDGFLTELRRRADAYFVETGRSERDCWQMYLKTAVILAWLATSYALLVFAAQ